LCPFAICFEDVEADEEDNGGFFSFLRDAVVKRVALPE
jgi:hypothetical protein